MGNRIFSQTTGPAWKDFGLVGWLEQQRVPLPLKGVECEFSVCGDLLTVEIDQIFQQNAARTLDCLYTFPLPADAAVHRCEMQVNGRVIRAEVEELPRARRLAQAERTTGRRAALVEMERSDLFTLTLGNLQPGDLIIIRFGYVETVSRLADWTSIRIPFCPGIRYIPGDPLLRTLRGTGIADDTDQVPDASRLSPPRVDALHPDAAYLAVRGVIEDPLGTVREISSPSHPVLVADGEGKYHVKLAGQFARPDSDFALRWSEPVGGAVQSVAWLLQDRAGSYALVQLRAPCAPLPLQHVSRDYYFLLDRSGSMSGLKWDKAVQSLRSFLDHLGSGDRACVVCFNNSWHDVAGQPLAAAELMVNASLRSLETLTPEGGTELLPALQHVFDLMRRHSVQREAVLLLITDGQVGNEDALLASFHAHPALRVHVLGIDTAINDALMSGLATQQRGSVYSLQPTDDIAGAVHRLATRLCHPVMSALTVDDGWELPGGRVPDLHSNECVSLTLKSNSTNAKEVVVRGQLPNGREEVFRLRPVDCSNQAIRLLWTRSRIRRFLGEGRSSDAIALAKQCQLACEETAFVARDETEQVSIAEGTIYQPSLFDRLWEPDFHLRGDLSQGHLGESAPRPWRKRLSWKHLAEADQRILKSLFRQVRDTPGSPPSSGRGRRSDTSVPRLGTLEQLPEMPAAKKGFDLRLFQAEFGPGIAACHERLKECFAAWANEDEGLAELLADWVANGGADTKRRMACVEELLNDLEFDAPAVECGFVIIFIWIRRSAGDDPTFEDRAEQWLRQAIQQWAVRHQGERREGAEMRY